MVTYVMTKVTVFYGILTKALACYGILTKALACYGILTKALACYGKLTKVLTSIFSKHGIISCLHTYLLLQKIMYPLTAKISTKKCKIPF